MIKDIITEKIITADITAEICPEEFGKLIRVYNELEKNEVLEIYLNTDGGDPDIADAMIDLINKNKKRTKLIGYGKLFSSGFNILLKVQCEKLILDGTLGMAHLASFTMDKFSSTNPTHVSHVDAYNKLIAYDKKKTLTDYKRLGLNKRELDIIRDGGDVYFQYNRLLELLNGES